MNKYFRFQSDSDLGVGIQYIEFSEKGWAIRQVECYEGRWFNSRKSYHQETASMGLCDQQLTEAGMKLGQLIDAEEFCLAWKLSNLKLETTDLEHKELEKKGRNFNINQNSTSNRVLVFGSSGVSIGSPDKQRIDSAEGETDSTL